MLNTQSLINDGVLAINPPVSPTGEKTVVVLGSARGGTTMVASVLQALGVFMGEKLGPVLEDVALSTAIESRDRVAVSGLIAKRNAAHAIWGWKRPAALEYADAWEGQFRNPYIIAIFRDTFAIANRNRISMLTEVFPNMERSIQYFGNLIGFLRQQTCPVLLCSYEKAMLNPETFVHAVDGFLNLQAQERWANARAKISLDPREYLESSRVTHSLGHLDTANERFCSGWAFFPRQPGRAAHVQIYVNDVLLQTVEARRPRPDVKEKNAHPTGLCGFRLEWPEGKRPAEGDSVAAKVEGDVKALKGSPRIVARAG